MKNSKGYFISFEGGEGTGKSTQSKLLSEYLKKQKIPCLWTREPGGTEVAEKIREILVTGKASKITPETELLLHYAARIEHIEKVIKPALQQNKIVISDRFFDSTYAYQGYGHGVDLQIIEKLNKITVEDFKPNVTFIFDIDESAGLKRAKTRADHENRYEKMGNSFHNKVRKGFLEIAKKNKKRCVKINADDTIDNLHKLVLKHLEKRKIITIN